MVANFASTTPRFVNKNEGNNIVHQDRRQMAEVGYSTYLGDFSEHGYLWRQDVECPALNPSNAKRINVNELRIEVKGNPDQSKCETGEFNQVINKDKPNLPACVSLQKPEDGVKPAVSVHNTWVEEKDGKGFMKFGIQLKNQGNKYIVETVAYEQDGHKSGVKDVNMPLGDNNVSLCIDHVNKNVVIKANNETGEIIDSLLWWNMSFNKMYDSPPVSIALSCEPEDYTISGECGYQEIRSREINDNVKKVQETYGYIIGIVVIAALGLGLFVLLYVCCDCDNRCDNRSENTSSEPRGSESRGSEARPENTSSEARGTEMTSMTNPREVEIVIGTPAEPASSSESETPTTKSHIIKGLFSSLHTPEGQILAETTINGNRLRNPYHEEFIANEEAFNRRIENIHFLSNLICPISLEAMFYPVRVTSVDEETGRTECQIYDLSSIATSMRTSNSLDPLTRKPITSVEYDRTTAALIEAIITNSEGLRV
tara:strand:- start:5681 stop:7135 length:1455 start_codon:yes stop_codon:yes gene_type:complete